MAASQTSGFLALRDRAHALVVERGSVAEAELLEHVYGGPTPIGVRAQLAAPLADDPRLLRTADGHWTLRTALAEVPQATPGEPSSTVTAILPLTVLAMAATGPRPGRGRIVRLAAWR